MRTLLFLASGVVAMGCLSWLGLRNKNLAQRKYEEWKYPVDSRKSHLSEALERDIELRKYNDVAREYKKVMGKLDQAESDGHDVDWLKKKMTRVARLLKEDKYDFAKIHLNTIEVRIPRKKESVAPAGDFIHNEGMTPDLLGGPKKAVPQKTRRSRSRVRTRTRG